MFRSVLNTAVGAAVLIVMVTTAAIAQSSYKVRVGDVLAVEVLEDSSLNRQVLVLPDGNISFPFAGTIRVAGRSVTDISTALQAGLASNFAAPPNVFTTVSTLGERRAAGAGGTRAQPTIAVYGLGALNKPGKLDVARDTTLLQYFAEVGGFGKFAATKRIQLRRRDPQSGQEYIFPFNFRAVEKGGRIDGAIVLRAGDVIVVPERRLFE
ncbi:polysaccharide biosynthesis/export family protein [Roseobacter sp. N2S]|uniref:polysaccharide biosynthesis/export family protein n=1 Tax=Roseobacter sp. N2S TaxID=2663844 RepID=UPI002857F263|nr:polysaccharide biosynthesis/export family protein [Roseobacter sp. N2S]MDR6267667.1 polysaccharide export outer membrane protein [Roseobacter sp. N2S]